MAERIDWLDDGTPYSPRFGDRYHSEQGMGLAQARGVFLQGCGLPEEWAGQAQWRILETGFGFGLNFLVTWAAWRADPQRPTLLHFVSLEAWPVAADDLLRVARTHPELAELAQALAAQYWGLLPGVHRLAFDGGRVLLTLCIGDAPTLLRAPEWTVDAVYLDGFSPACNPELWSLQTLKAIARCCRRGTRLATWTVARSVRDALTQCGFTVAKVPGIPPKRHNVQATFDPRWEPRKARPAQPTVEAPAHCLVIGGGLAGAAVASSLARRGWQVQVLDGAEAPAAGASGLPAGLFCPHISPDDSVISRLSRSGIRVLLGQAQNLLQAGVDWQPNGVLEHRVEGRLGLPPQWHDGPGIDWSQAAAADLLRAAGLPPDATACWHAKAGWIRPARLVSALLAQPGIAWRGGATVARLHGVELEGRIQWQALDAQAQVLAQAPRVVLAAGFASRALSGEHLPLQALRGQISWGVQDAALDAALPPFPVNGEGNLVTHIPLDDGGRAWYLGSTFERGIHTLPPTPAERVQAHAANRQRLSGLLPGVLPALEQALAPAWEAGVEPPLALPPVPAVQSWAAVRCAAPDRLPIVGPLDSAALPGLWACTAMGARGLTLALLCAEVLAARWHGEPLPLEAKLAQALAAERF
ncbi:MULTISPECIES: bifunctional tRNA (5-methylaminomethyl-2-thiouridine)(34)-methyltransferase MnmC2/FAD-dependent 5-carboxymethylaminomethyl-2-thiouridine(34) oxidoreductase MnmC1 [Giesbergeria]|uniref:tRNA 5-methylaminomethyl-2-thiouridine biosynthesis bifunctional protein MnmC n=1 Tax=Giesbergeria sinuosa TaxID=80883 RepID=A0ABV9QEE3_9BURK